MEWITLTLVKSYTLNELRSYTMQIAVLSEFFLK